MSRYMKKPIAIDALPYEKGLEDGFDGSRPYINTLEGKLYISSNDYIITGVRGERYPIKKDIFLETYEEVK